MTSLAAIVTHAPCPASAPQTFRHADAKPCARAVCRHLVLDKFEGPIAALRAGVEEACGSSSVLKQAWHWHGADAVSTLFVGGRAVFQPTHFNVTVQAGSRTAAEEAIGQQLVQRWLAEATPEQLAAFSEFFCNKSGALSAWLLQECKYAFPLPFS